MISKIISIIKFALKWAPVVVAAAMAYSQIKKQLT